MLAVTSTYCYSPELASLGLALVDAELDEPLVSQVGKS